MHNDATHLGSTKPQRQNQLKEHEIMHRRISNSLIDPMEIKVRPRTLCWRLQFSTSLSFIGRNRVKSSEGLLRAFFG